MAMIFAMLFWGLSWSNAKIAGQYADPQLLMFWNPDWSGRIGRGHHDKFKPCDYNHPCGIAF